jgi:surface protein
MKLVENRTFLPLDLVVFINSFIYEKITDENFTEAIVLWFGNRQECKLRFGRVDEWNTSRVTNMERAFYHKGKFNSDISRWNVSNVTNMRQMFQGAKAFNVTNMRQMFQGGKAFNGDLSRWDVGNVTNMNQMFKGASQFNGDLSRWKTSKVSNMSHLFCGAKQFNRDINGM